MSASNHFDSQSVSHCTTCEVLTWKDPVVTAKIFGAILGSLILVKVNILNHLFHLAYVALLISAAAEYSGRFLTGQGFVSKYYGTPKFHSQTFRDSVLPALGSAAETIEVKAHQIIFAKDLEATLKTAGASYILYKLSSWFSLYSLIFGTVLLAFSAPPVYKQNKKEIDAAVAQYTRLVRTKASEYSSCAQKKIAPHIDTLVKKTGPVGSFVQSKFPTRTAGSTVGSEHYSRTTASQPSAGAATDSSTGVSTGVSTSNSEGLSGISTNAGHAGIDTSYSTADIKLPQAPTGAPVGSVEKTDLFDRDASELEPTL